MSEYQLPISIWKLFNDINVDNKDLNESFVEFLNNKKFNNTITLSKGDKSIFFIVEMIYSLSYSLMDHIKLLKSTSPEHKLEMYSMLYDMVSISNKLMGLISDKFDSATGAILKKSEINSSDKLSDLIGSLSDEILKNYKIPEDKLSKLKAGLLSEEQPQINDQ